MTEITTLSCLGESTAEAGLADRAASRPVATTQVCLFVLALAVAGWAGHTANWDLPELGILVLLAAVSDLTSTALASGRMNVSGSFLGMTLAAVLLGGTPAAIVGVLTIGISWIRWRERGPSFRQNLLMFAWFPLLSGLLFQWLSKVAHVTPQYHHYYYQPTYYVLVFAIFVVALVMNFVMAAIYSRVVSAVPLLKRLAEFRPILAAELSSALLTLVAVFITDDLHTAGLLMLAIVLVVYQYLVGELLLSQRRGEKLRVQASTDSLTGLANRSHFNDEVDATIAGSEGTPAAFGVLLIDLDHFKDINDTLGHQYGDDFLADLGP
ncbi:MAG: diguanylate cyclase domain-containing protein, partial [Solirubrobacteraceae bacterium]